ncbi:hypothetical protein KCP69_26645 (plasmid) [Salmonella enterica subsp. enterica]|nr:hypothetical protein KCP69_26645 [Salmonella enterica subsp. enterica]
MSLKCLLPPRPLHPGSSAHGFWGCLRGLVFIHTCFSRAGLPPPVGYAAKAGNPLSFSL